MIRLSGVSRTFEGRSGRVEALRGIDLDVAEGEFVAVLGRSGCGKSTLLRLIAGLLPLTAGEITVAGTPITRPRQDIAMLFQQPALLPWRTVLDNVLLPVEIFGWSRAKHRERAQRTAGRGRVGRLREAAAARTLRRHAAAGRRCAGR